MYKTLSIETELVWQEYFIRKKYMLQMFLTNKVKNYSGQNNLYKPINTRKKLVIIRAENIPDFLFRNSEFTQKNFNIFTECLSI